MVDLAIPVEITAVQPLSKNLVHEAAVKLAPSQLQTFGVDFVHQTFYRIPAGGESFKQFRNHRCSVGVRDNHALTAGTVRIPIPNRSAAWIDAGPSFLGHPFIRLFGQVLAVVARYQYFDAVNELLGRFRVRADYLVFLDQMNGDAEFVERSIVREVPVQAVDLLHQNRSASRMFS